MKRNGLYVVFFLVIILLFTSCLTKEQPNTLKNVEVSQNSNNSYSSFKLTKDSFAVELTFKGKINSEDFVFSNIPFKIVSFDGNNTIVSLSFGELKKKNFEFLKVKGNPVLLNSLSVDSLSTNITKTSTDTTPMLLGDFNHDSYIDLYDFAYFKEHYRTSVNNPGYDQMYDIYPSTKGTDIFENIFSLKQPDGKVDIFDFAVFTINYRKAANRPPVVKIVSPKEDEEIHGGLNNITINNLDPDLNNIVYDIYLNDNKVESDINILSKNLNLDYPKDYLLTIVATDVVNNYVTPLSSIATVSFKTINTPPIISFTNLNEFMPYNFKLSVVATDIEDGE